MYFLGDVHGKFHKIIADVERFDIQNTNIIQVGDFGAGFPDINTPYLETLGQILYDKGITMYVIRGNHDDPAYFEMLSCYGKGLYLVPDYTYLALEGKRLLLIGGGVSIDKSQRNINESWWPDEGIVIKDIPIKDVDILVTHVPPANIFFASAGKGIVDYWCKADQFLRDELAEEKKKIEHIAKNVECKHWISGHYHIPNTVFDGDKHYAIVGELQYLPIY